MNTSMMSFALLVVALFGAACEATILYEERFDATWADRWLHSSWKKSEGTAAEFTLSAGQFHGADEEADKGIQTGPDSKFFALYTDMGKTIDNTGKDLVLQYSVKHEQNLDCGGGYIKLIPASSAADMESFGGETPYSIMFGPDICGQTKKVHVILNYNGENHLIKTDIKAKSDSLTHVYTLVIKPDNTYAVYIDLEEVAKGSLEEDWDMLLPKTIKDPKASKPEEWDERPKIDDPEVSKPDGYDDIPPTIADPEATMPEDWDEEEDGTWEAPTIPNPEFKGEWRQPQIENPEYKGMWVAPDIENPEYVSDPNLYVFPESKFLGFELWQVKTGTIFDNIMVGDSFDDAKAFAESTWGAMKEAEKDAYEKDKEEKAAASKAAAAAAGEGEGEDEGDDMDDEYDDMAAMGGMGGGAHDEL
eukprot:gene2098-18158_t